MSDVEGNNGCVSVLAGKDFSPETIATVQNLLNKWTTRFRISPEDLKKGQEERDFARDNASTMSNDQIQEAIDQGKAKSTENKSCSCCGCGVPSCSGCSGYAKSCLRAPFKPFKYFNEKTRNCALSCCGLATIVACGLGTAGGIELLKSAEAILKALHH